MSAIGVVVIGRNEGDRLRRCLESLEAESYPIVYVDSGSTDGSVSLAESHGVDVVELDPARPFSAGRARNEGFARCLQRHPEVEFVMFVDGDCEVVAGWLTRARSELEARPELAVVCGRRRELNPARSVYNRLADLEWDTPIGLASACGGDALFRVSDFVAVEGFNPAIKAGEEPELCQRLRQQGRQIARVDAEMTRHDLNMTRFSEWWRRQLRVGYHGFDIESRFQPRPAEGLAPEPSLFGASLRRAWIWGIGWPILVVAVAGIGWFAAGIVGMWCGIALCCGLLVAQAVRLAWRIRRRVSHPREAVAHGLLMVAEKWANLAGQIQYLWDRQRGRGAKLIEYKQPTSAGRTQ